MAVLAGTGALAQQDPDLGAGATSVDLAPGAQPGDTVELTGTLSPNCMPGSAEVGFTPLTPDQVSVEDSESLTSDDNTLIARLDDVVPGDAFAIQVILPDPGIPEPTLYIYCLQEVAGEIAIGSGHWQRYTFGAAGDAPGGSQAPGVPSTPGSASFDDGRPHVVTAVPAASEAPWSPRALVVAGLIAVGLVLLVVFPSELFNSTLDEHHDEIMAGVRRRLPWVGRGPAPASDAEASSRGWFAFVAITAASALLYGLLDPGFGANQASAVLVVGVAAGVAVSTLLAAGTTGWLAKRRFGSADYWFKVLPATLLIAALCVAISRLVGFLPGYLYGLVGGLAFRRVLDATDQARVVVASSLAVLVAALAGWLAYGAVAAHIDQGATGIGWVVAEAILAGTFIAGVEGLLFGLLPLRYLSGEKLYRHSKAAWAALYVPVMFVFVHLVARPAAAEDPSAVSWAKTLVLFGIFGAASVAFWAYWRRRDNQAQTPAPPGPGALEPATDVPSASA